MARRRRRSLAALLIALIGLAPVAAFAEVGGGAGNGTVSVSSTATTTSFASARTSVTIINDKTSANELYARVFWCSETPAAATTSSPIRLEPGDWVTVAYNAKTEGQSLGYCGYSLVTAALETATARVVSK